MARRCAVCDRPAVEMCSHPWFNTETGVMWDTRHALCDHHRPPVRGGLCRIAIVRIRPDTLPPAGLVPEGVDPAASTPVVYEHLVPYRDPVEGGRLWRWELWESELSKRVSELEVEVKSWEKWADEWY